MISTMSSSPLFRSYIMLKISYFTTLIFTLILQTCAQGFGECSNFTNKIEKKKSFTDLSLVKTVKEQPAFPLVDNDQQQLIFTDNCNFFGLSL